MEVSVGLLATVAGILGTLISVFASLVPLRMFFSLRSCEGSETGHYVDAIFSSGLWAAYAFYTNQPIVLFGNVFSFSIQTIFVCLSLYLAPNKAQNATTLKYIFHKISVFVVILLLARCLCHGSRCIQILGIVSMLVSLYCYLKTINVIREAPQKGNLRMPALITLAALLWLTYGLARSEYYIAVTSAFGLAVGVLGLHSNMQDREEEAPPSNTTVIYSQRSEFPTLCPEEFISIVVESKAKEE